MKDKNRAIELNSLAFTKAVKRVLLENPWVEEIVETGTHRGTGSTQIWASTGLPVKTIEVNPSFHEEARENLKDFYNVELFLGTSLSISEMEDFIRENEEYYRSAEEKNICCEPDAVDFYLTEVNGGGFCAIPRSMLFDWKGGFEVSGREENLLPKFINNDKKQLIFLDSAGGIGFLEYQKVMELSDAFLEKKILFLDDINHVKHHRSVLDLEEQGRRVVRIEDGRSCYCVL